MSVLFCDLVGFTSRAEALDPEEVRAIQAPYYERVRAELERHGGTVEKFIGDAVMALFGAPVSHEDDPERAVRAAVAIREWVIEREEIRIRIAITTGEALVRLEAQPLTGEGMASGDIVNTAARLQSAAPENGVLVDETTYRATKDAVDYRGAKPVGAKGKAEPVPVWEALRATVPIRPTRAPRSPFVGRGHELAVLKDSFASGFRESSIRLVTLVGVPGIGKSRLIQEFFKAVERDGTSVTWLQGRSLPYGTGVTLWALGEIVKSQAGILESDDREEADEKLRLAVASAIADAGDAGWVHAHLRPLVAVSDGEDVAGDRRAEAFAAWRRLFEALAGQQPLILVFEDVHWADDALLDFVDYLVEWGTEGPLCVLASARPELLERRPEWAAGRANTRTMTLAALSQVETVQLLTSLLERSLPEEAQRALLAQAGGNPLYAEEYVRLLAGREEGADLGEVPETVQGIIAARIDALPPADKELLQDAAVVGKVFWSGAVATLARRDRWSVEERLLTLERRELIRREQGSSVEGETQYAFGHELMCDVAYGEIPRATRAAKHVRAAEWIESLGRPEDHAEFLSHHYLRALEHTRATGDAKDALQEQARTALREAGDRASSLNAFPQAAHSYRDALALSPRDDPERPQSLFRYAEALHATGDPQQQWVLEDARKALLAAGDLETAAEAEVLLAEMWWLRGSSDGTEEHLQRAVRLVQGRPPSRGKVRVLAAVARFKLLADEREEAIRVGREALVVAEDLDLSELRADVLITVGTARWQVGDTGGETDLERGIALALEADSRHILTRGYNNLALVAGDKGDVAEKIELLRQAQRVNEHLGDREGARFTQAKIAAEMFERGNWDGALEVVDDFIADCEAGRGHIQEAGVRCMRAWISLGRGEVEDALVDSERAVALARDLGAYDPAGALAWVANIYTHLGDIAEAQALADELISQGPETVADLGFDLAWIADRIGRSAAFLRVTDTASYEETAGTWFRPIPELILAGDAAKAADRLGEMGRWATEADTRLLAARQLIQSDEYEEANEQLEKALAFYNSVGATRFIREAESLVSITG